MTAENPADTVIEQFIAEEFAFQPASEVPLQAQRLRIRLRDAGLLLADPADQDELRSQLRRARQQRDDERAAKEGNWKALGEWSARAERAEAERDELRADYAALVNSQHRVEADLAALRNRIGSIAGVLRCVDAPAASMIQDALDGGDPK